MTKDEVLKLALEAFEYIENNYMSLPAPATKAITAIREALAQPDVDRRSTESKETFDQQEPVALEDVYLTIIQWDVGGGKRSRRELARRIVAKYTTPPSNSMNSIKSSNTLDAQRKPLTEKRIEELYSFWVVDCQDIVGFARAVERTVKGEV